MNNQQLLDNNWVESFFNENLQSIFQHAKEVRVIEIKRSFTFDQKSYNILCFLEIDGQRKEARLYSSHKHNVKKAFEAMKFFYENGFAKDDFRVPRPYAFFKNLNMMIYENIPGQTFMHELDQDVERLKTEIMLMAQVLKKIHSLPKPSFEVAESDWRPNEKDISKNQSHLFKKIAAIKETIFRKLDENKSDNFCHGDFQPNNLIIDNEKVYILDFGSVCITDKELDLASFIIQLQIMLKKFGEVNNFSELKNVFLTTYGDFDQRKFDLYVGLIGLVLLEFMLSFPEFENNKKYTPFILTEVQNNLAKSGIKFENET